MKPFLKWPGNKYTIVDSIKAVLPPGKRLIEPFAGSASVFLNTDYSRYLIAEVNPDLINLYRLLQQEGGDFIDYAERFFVKKNNCAERFYALRDRFNQTDDTRLKSAMFIYFNKHGFNGLCRYNLKGEYNVPFGFRTHVVHFPRKEVEYFSKKAAKANFIHADFLETMKQAKKGDVVYCDPPYVPLSKTANFTSYSKDGFNLEQQIELARCAEQLAARGITVIISNHDTKFIRETYQKAEINTLSVQRLISRDAKTRHRVDEVLAVFHGKK